MTLRDMLAKLAEYENSIEITEPYRAKAHAYPFFGPKQSPEPPCFINTWQFPGLAWGVNGGPRQRHYLIQIQLLVGEANLANEAFAEGCAAFHEAFLAEMGQHIRFGTAYIDTELRGLEGHIYPATLAWNGKEYLGTEWELAVTVREVVELKA